MPWNLLILPLVGGYYIISKLNILKHDPRIKDRQRLIFDSVICGFFLLGATFGLRFLVEIRFDKEIDYIYHFFPVHYRLLGTSSACLLLAITGTKILNKTIYKNDIKYALRSVTEFGNEFQLLSKDSYLNSKLLQFTLDTKMVYVCYVKEAVWQDSNYVRVIPVLSGYIDDRKKINFTNSFVDNPNDLDLVLALDNVVSASYFILEPD